MYSLIEVGCKKSDGYTEELFKVTNSLTWKRIAESITNLAPDNLKPMYGFTASNRLFLLVNSGEVQPLQFIIRRVASEVFNCKPEVRIDKFKTVSECIVELSVCSRMYWAMYDQLSHQFNVKKPDGNSFTGVGFTLAQDNQVEAWNGNSPFPSISVLSNLTLDYDCSLDEEDV